MVSPSAKPPAAPPTGARRSPAAPRRADVVPCSGPALTRRRRSVQSPRSPAAAGIGSSSPPTIAPMRSRIRRKPVRVQFTPTPRTSTRDPGTRRPTAIMNAAEERSPGTARRPNRARRCSARSPASRRGAPTPAPASIRSVWSRLGAGSTTVSCRRQQPREQQAGLHLGACDRKLVLIAAAAGRDGERRQPASVASDRAPMPQRLRDAVDGRRRMIRRRRLVIVSSCPRQPAGQQPQERPCVADVDRLRRAHLVRAGRRLHRPRVALFDPRADRPQRRERRERVGGAEVVPDLHRLCATSPRAAPRGARSTCRAAG